MLVVGHCPRYGILNIEFDLWTQITCICSKWLNAEKATTQRINDISLSFRWEWNWKPSHASHKRKMLFQQKHKKTRQKTSRKKIKEGNNNEKNEAETNNEKSNHTQHNFKFLPSPGATNSRKAKANGHSDYVYWHKSRYLSWKKEKKNNKCR